MIPGDDDIIDDIVRKYVWKSPKNDVTRCLILHEKKFNNFTFTNPICIIRKYMNTNTSDVMIVKVYKWFPCASLHFPYTFDIRIKKEGDDFLVYIQDFLCNMRELNYESQYVLRKDECLRLFNHITNEYHKKISKIEINTNMVYTSPTDRFSYMNPYVMKIAAMRIENEWLSYQQRQKQKRRFHNVIEEVSLIPPGGYDGRRKEIVGGNLYWKSYYSFISTYK